MRNEAAADPIDPSALTPHGPTPDNQPSLVLNAMASNCGLLAERLHDKTIRDESLWKTAKELAAEYEGINEEGEKDVEPVRVRALAAAYAVVMDLEGDAAAREHLLRRHRIKLTRHERNDIQPVLRILFDKTYKRTRGRVSIWANCLAFARSMKQSPTEVAEFISGKIDEHAATWSSRQRLPEVQLKLDRENHARVVKHFNPEGKKYIRACPVMECNSGYRLTVTYSGDNGQTYAPVLVLDWDSERVERFLQREARRMERADWRREEQKTARKEQRGELLQIHGHTSATH